MTDEQIIQSLPPGLQGDLKAFGPLEKRSADEMYDFLNAMRKKYTIPPWHAFTLLLQRAGYATGREGKGLTRSNMWCRAENPDESPFVLDIPASQDWVYISVTGQQADGTITGHSEVAVQPSTGRVWLMYSESPFAGADGVFLAPEKACGKPYGGKITIKDLVHGAMKALRRNEFSIKMTKTVKRMRRSIVRNTPVPVPKQEEPEQSLLPEPVVAANGSLTDLQRSTMLIVFEMGAAKARELGMHSTIARWRTELAPVIGPEVHHVSD